MTTADDVRALALALPEVTEGTHFRLTAFRVRGRSFVSVEPDGTHAMFSLDPPQVRAAVAEGAEEVRRGDQVLGIRVALADVPAERLARLVELAWRGRAPRTLVARVDEESESH